MVLLPDGRAKIRAEGYAEGFAKGYADGYADGYVEGWAEAAPDLARIRSAWLRWNARRLDSESRGEPFDEPPPMPPDGYRKGESDDGGSK